MMAAHILSACQRQGTSVVGSTDSGCDNALWWGTLCCLDTNSRAAYGCSAWKTLYIPHSWWRRSAALDNQSPSSMLSSSSLQWTRLRLTAVQTVYQWWKYQYIDMLTQQKTSLLLSKLICTQRLKTTVTKRWCLEQTNIRFQFWRNVSNDKSGRRTWAGRSFQIRGPAAVKARSPRRVLVLVRVHLKFPDDRSCRRLVAATSWQSSDR